MRSLREGYGSKLLIAALTVTTLVWALGMAVIPASAASRHTEGSVVVSNGTVWYISATQRHGFPTPEVYFSYGYTFAQVQAALDGDLALPVGANRDFADGTLVNDNGTIWIISGGMKRGFPTPEVFNGLGYSFAMALKGSTANFTAGAVISSATSAHPAGALVNSNGTIWWITATGRKGIPSLEVFNSYGLKFSQVMPANAADLALTNEGTVTARNNGGSVITDGTGVSGSITASLASDNPAPMTLVAGQAAADLAHFTFSGSGTITAMTFDRIGVSADTTLSNVYVFNGATRVTDAASVSSGKITYSGLNLAVNGSMTLAVKSDIASGTAGQTVGVKLTSFTVSGGSAANTSISGNVHTIATASLATVAMSNAAGGGATDPGNDINVWQGTATVGTRNVTFNRLALRQVGSVNASDINNFRLLVDGVQVASAASLDSNGYVTFTPNSTLTTGARTLKVLANIVGGSGRTYQMSLRGAYDINTTDTNFNVGVLATGTFPFGPASATINAGSLTVVKATDSASGNVTLTASDVVLAKYTLTAFGEAVKVETMRFSVDISDNTVTSLRNGRVMINGTQYGSTASLTETATGTVTYTTNFTVTPGSPATVEVRADVFEGSGAALAAADTVQVIFEGGDFNNGIPQVSLTPIDVPSADVNANSLTVDTGAISMAQTSSFGAQTTTAPQTGYKIASFQLSGDSTEATNITGFNLDITVGQVGGTPTIADVTDVYIKYGNSTTSVKPTVTATDNTWSPSFTLGVNESMQIDVFASFNSDFVATDTITADLQVTGTTASSSTAADTGEIADQAVTVQTGSITASQDASSPSAQLVDDSGTVKAASYKFVTLYDAYTITDINLNLGSASAVQTVTLKDGSTTVASKPAATDIQFTGLSIPVAANTTKVLDVELTMAAIGSGMGSTDSNITVTLDMGAGLTVARNSQGTSGTISGSDDAAETMYAYKAVPLVTYVNLPTSALTNGTKTLAKFTVSSNGTGTIAWKQLLLEISKGAAGTDNGTDAPVVVTPTLWNADTGEQITGATLAFLAASDTETACEADATACYVLVTIDADGSGVAADDDAEQQISGARTYEVRATVNGTLASGDFITAMIDRNTSAHANAAAFLTNDNGDSATGSSFVWSDVSAAGHDTGTTDWVPDYLLKVLPTSTWNLNF